MRIGAFDYVPKPFDFEVIDRIVMAAAAVGAAGVGSPFGLNGAAARPRALTAEGLS